MARVIGKQGEQNMAKIGWLFRDDEDDDWTFMETEPASWHGNIKRIVYFDIEGD